MWYRSEVPLKKGSYSPESNISTNATKQIAREFKGTPLWPSNVQKHPKLVHLEVIGQSCTYQKLTNTNDKWFTRTSQSRWLHSEPLGVGKGDFAALNTDAVHSPGVTLCRQFLDGFHGHRKYWQVLFVANKLSKFLDVFSFFRVHGD